MVDCSVQYVQDCRRNRFNLRPPMSVMAGLSNVCIYLNQFKGNYSCRKTIGGTVDTYADSIFLVDCVFHISENKKRQAVERETRNVHAWVRGTPCLDWERVLPEDLSDWHQITYRFLETDTFETVEGEAVEEAKYVLATPEGVWATGVVYAE